MKFKNLMLIFGLLVTIIACSSDDDGDSFDAAAQALIDDANLIDYLKTHHYVPPQNEDVFGVIDTIFEGETFTPIYDNIKVKEIEEDDIRYNLYYLVNNEGANTNPTKGDSVLVQYRGFRLDSTKFDERLSYTWLSMPSLIRGWQFGFENFKDGNLNTPLGEPLAFDDTGNGILFIPSGLAYANQGTFSIPPNEPILFLINLGLVEIADHDNDLILSINEDVDGDSNLNNDDTDNDRIPNYQDIDDDGDGTLTRDENPDPNGDGNPDDAKDTDGDGIPDYLDPDTN